MDYGYVMVKIFHLALAASLISAGCSSKTLTVPVAAFDDSVGKAVKLHNKQLDQVVKAHNDALRDDLAKSGKALFATGECDLLLIQYTPELAAACRLTLRGGGEIDADPVRVERLKALATSLGGYAAGLTSLTEDPKKDRKAFADAAGKLSGTVGALQGQVVRAGGRQVLDKNELKALTALAIEAGALYFERRRSQALRDIIVATHPVVVEATKILGESDRNAHTAILARTVAVDLVKAQAELSDLLSGSPSDSKVRKAQDKVFKAHQEYLVAASLVSAFGEIGAAHEALAAAAQSGLSGEDLLTLAERLTSLAGQVDATVDAFE